MNFGARSYAEHNDNLDDVRYQHHLKHRGSNNRQLVRIAWLAISIALVTSAVYRVFWWWTRRRSHKNGRPRLFYLSAVNWIRQVSAFLNATALCSLPVLFGRISITSLSLGQVLVTISYSCFVASLLVSVDAPRFSPHFLDDVAFRAAWITLAQVPLVYLLSTKRGPLNILAGVSHERVNWLHRWVGRILFVSATAHMAIMKSSISLQDILQSPEKGMAVVRYGVGAYGMLGWIALTSVLPLRRWNYRLFYLNHCISTLAFPFVLLKHVPSYARSPVYVAFSIIAIDRCLICYAILYNNFSIRSLKQRLRRFGRGPHRQVLSMGHAVKMMAPYMTNLKLEAAESTTIIRICDLPFSWRPGQHVRLHLPRFGALEVHPFTPATCSQPQSPPFVDKGTDVESRGLLPGSSAEASHEMIMMIKSHSGFTQKVADYYREWLALPCPNSSKPSSSLTAYIDGPYGNPPAWEEHEDLILVASSTGVSFILSIMDYLEQLCFDNQAQLRTQRIRLIWTNRHIEPQFEAAVTDLLCRHSTMLRESGVAVKAEFFTTCTQSTDHSPQMRDFDPFSHLRRAQRWGGYFSRRPPLRIRNPDEILQSYEEHTDDDEQDVKEVEPIVSEIMGSRASFETYVSSTLVGSEDEREEEEDVEDAALNGFSDLESMNDELESSCWSRMSSPWPLLRRLRLRSTHGNRRAGCQCALMQSLRLKLFPQSRPNFITRRYGLRPNVSQIIAASTPPSSERSTMVAVCSNQVVTAGAKNTVAKLNWEFAFGRRKSGVEIFTEGFT